MGDQGPTRPFIQKVALCLPSPHTLIRVQRSGRLRRPPLTRLLTPRGFGGSWHKGNTVLVPEFTAAYAGMCFTHFMPKDLYAFLHETTAVKMDALGESMRLLYHKYDAGGPLRAITGPQNIIRRQTFAFPPSLMRPERFHEFAYMLRSISVSAFGCCMSSSFIVRCSLFSALLLPFARMSRSQIRCWSTIPSL